MPWKVKYPVENGKKRCSKCRKVRDVSEFYVRTIRGKAKLDAHCCFCCREYTKKWVRENPKSKRARNEWKKNNPERHAFLMWRSHIMRHYGLTPEDYDRMLQGQNGLCAICRGPSGDVHFHIDHDHAIKKVRGLLCLTCNNSLHKAEQTGWIQSVIQYLASTSA